MSLSLSVAAARRPAWWGWRLAWRVLLGLLLAAWALGLAAWLGFYWLILPRLDDWRPTIAAQASRALGQTVQIGQIAVHSSGWVPAFVLRDVVLRDALGREALRLPQVSAALSVPSLLALRLRFEQLLIEDARLEVRRDAQGRWVIAGLDVQSTGAAMDASAAADWFFEQHELVIRGGLLRWVDELRAAPPLQLDDVLLVVRNSGRRHELRLDATPPPSWGQRFTLRAHARSRLLARAGDWQRWKGALYADLPQVDVNGLRRHVDLPVDLQQGQAALRAWIDWDQGLPVALTLDAALRDVSVRLAQDLQPLGFAALDGRFVAERSATGVSLVVDHLAFTTTEGQVWAPSRLSAQWRQAQAMSLAVSLEHGAASRPVTGGEFSADRLDLAALADLAERLPIGAGMRDLLHQLNPEGTVAGLQARWDGPLDAPRTYSAKAKVQGLAIAAAPSPEPGGIGRPGWRGASLDLSATETGGQAELGLADGAIELPGVFEQATVPLARFAAQLQWRFTPQRAGTPGNELAPRIDLKVQNARFDNADARGVLNASWRSGAGSGFGKGGRLPGVLELSGTLTEGRAIRVARYLPLGIGEHTRSWVQRAVQAGELRDVSFRVQGDLWDFPYVNRRDGEFRIAGKVQDVVLAPVPSVPAGGREPAWESPWPAFAAVSGELVFERNAMQFQQASGRLWGSALSAVQGSIRELSDHALLEIEGQSHGPASDLLRYLHTTPLGDWTGQVTSQATLAGAVDLNLVLAIPLARPADSTAKAVLQLAGNDLRLRPDLPAFPGARGRIEASQKGFQVTALRTQLAGGDAQIDGGTQADGSQRFAIVGSASAEGLRRTPELGTAVQRLARHLQGQAGYRALVGVQASHTEWQVASNLQGMALNLPAPLGKPAETPLQLRLGWIGAIDPLVLATPAGQALVLPAADARRSLQQDWLRVELGALQASLVLGGQANAPKLVRAALAYNRPLPEPVAGGIALLDLPRLDVEPWRALADPAAWGIGSSPPVTAGTEIDAAGWLPQTIKLKTPELLALGRRLSDVTLDLQRLTTPGNEGWRATGQADQAAGTVEYLDPRRPGGAGRVLARLSRLSLPPAEAETVADSMAGLLDRAPAAVPALDIEIEDFELRGHKLGKLVVQAVNSAPGTEPAAGGDATPRSEWRLNRLQLANDDARLSATGRWQALPGQQRRHMALDFKLDIDDSGALLQRLGMGGAVKGAKGKIEGSLGWDGSPLGFDVPSLGGRFGLAIERGQFLKANAGAARLLGVLSLQALPRRLLLDFRDVFQDGFEFDTVVGDVRVQRGVASTDNLRLRGLQAVVLMAGSADIARETQDLQVVALPELNTASASLAYAAVNPAVALGAFLGQWLLREPLRQASAREFHISGSWDNPKVEPIERKLFDPLPAAAAIEPPASPVSAVAAMAAAVATPAASAVPLPSNRP